MSTANIFVVAVWAAEQLSNTSKLPKFELGWLGLIVPVTGVALTAIIRALRAEDRVRRHCDEPVNSVRDSILSGEIRPTLARIVVGIQPYMVWPYDPNAYLRGEPGDPELDVARILGYRQATFSDAFMALESHYRKISSAGGVYARLVAHDRRCGIAMAIFLIPWLYVSLVLSLPEVKFPGFMIPVAIAALASTASWAACEWFNGNRENNQLSALASEARRTFAGQTS